MDIRIRGISYHLEFHQQKEKLPTMVLLHGFLGSGDSFKPLIPLLAEFSNPVTIDLLGHGKTQGAELHYRFSTKEQVADIVKLISEQLQTPLFLYGYSMGARLALQTALHRPDLFQGLLLESGTFGIEGETERQVRQSLTEPDLMRSWVISRIFLKNGIKSPCSPQILLLLKLSSILKFRQVKILFGWQIASWDLEPVRCLVFGID